MYGLSPPETKLVGFPCYSNGVLLLGVSTEKKYWRMYWPGQSVDCCCPVHLYVPLAVPAPSPNTGDRIEYR